MSRQDTGGAASRLRAGGLGVTAAAVLLAGGTLACGSEDAGHVPKATAPVEVDVSAATTVAGHRSVPATVEADRTARVATRTSGTVERVPVDVGSRVRAGDTLVALDDEEVEAGIESAEAALRKARKYHDRIASLAEDGAATEQELDDARAGLERARAALKRARNQRSYVALQAPFDGVVTRRRVDPGDLATPGRPVVTLVEPSSVNVVADLPAALAPKVEVGTEVEVLDPGTGRRADARVVRLSPALQPATRQFRVEARFREGATGGLAVSPGSYVRLEFPGVAPPSVWVPRDAVIERGQLRGVFLVRADTLRLRWIRIGRRREGSVEVLAGLDPGQRVVRSPDARLVDGTPVERAASRSWSPAFGTGRTSAGSGGPAENGGEPELAGAGGGGR